MKVCDKTIAIGHIAPFKQLIFLDGRSCSEENKLAELAIRVVSTLLRVHQMHSTAKGFFDNSVKFAQSPIPHHGRRKRSCNDGRISAQAQFAHSGCGTTDENFAARDSFLQKGVLFQVA
jgi:hypothetical protein